jgi:putative spermidine/putrescine transport system ATP-binding protein
VAPGRVVIETVECRGISVALGDRVVLDRLALQVVPGSVCAVIGASGSGKTTLLRSVAGIEAPNSGSVLIEGVDVTPLPPQQRNVTLLFQEPRLFPALSVGENVAFALRVRGAGREQRRAAAAELLHQVGLDDRLDDPVAGLSGGEQQRVALARSLCVPPAVLLLDEPFSAVDAPRRRELRTLVGDLLQLHRVTTLLVSHDVADARILADTLAVLADGRIAQHDTVDQVLAAPVDQRVAELVAADEPRRR